MARPGVECLLTWNMFTYAHTHPMQGKSASESSESTVPVKTSTTSGKRPRTGGVGAEADEAPAALEKQSAEGQPPTKRSVYSHVNNNDKKIIITISIQ